MIIALIVSVAAGVSTLLGFAPKAIRARRTARALAAENTDLRRAARRPIADVGHDDEELHWFPDPRGGGWRLAGRYLPTSVTVPSVDI